MNFKTLLLLLGISQNIFSQKFYLFVGTYTSKTSEGIYVYEFDTKSADLKLISIAKGIKNPSFFTISPNQKYIYSVGETDKNGFVYSFKFDDKNGEMKLVNFQEAGGDHPCHISVDKSGKWLILGNYSGGNLTVFPVNSEGSIGKLTQLTQHEGKGTNPKRQEKPHVHSVNFDIEGKNLIVADLGIDKLICYNFDSKTGNMAKKSVATLSGGAGPRHFVFHPNNKFAYVIEELSSTISVFDYNNGNLSIKQNISTLPKDFSGTNYTADIHISADGKFLYGSNRGHNSLAIYSIDQQDGQLTLVGHQDVRGEYPRNFMIDPTDNFVLVANQNTDNIVVFGRDKTTGKLNFTGKEIKVSMPVCLKMMKK